MAYTPKDWTTGEIITEAELDAIEQGLAAAAAAADTANAGLANKVNTSTYTAGLAAKADTASLATVATTGSYTDLTNKPSIPAAYTDEQAQDATAAALAAGTHTGVSVAYNDAGNAISLTATGTTSPDATTTSKGIVQLAGDLAGTAAAPTVPGLAGKLTAASNLSDVASVAAARTNLGLGTAATQASTAFDTAGAAAAVLPTQTGNSGKFLTTNGTAVSWGTPAGGGGAGLPATVVNKTTAYTAAAGDFVQADVTTAGFTVTLPAAPAVGALVAVKKVDATANTLTIAPSGGGTIDGDPNATTTTKMAGAIFEHVGSNVWRIVASMTTTGPAGPTGATGATGTAGAAATVTVGTTTTLAAGASATVTNAGTTSAATLNFGIPQGAAGATGQGVPVGGTTGQILAKTSNTDYATGWIAAPTGGGGGGAPPPFIAVRGRAYIPPFFGGTTNTLTLNAGDSYGVPIYLPAGTVTRLSVPASTGTNTPGTARLGMFTLDQTTPQNSALLIDAGAVDLSNANANNGITISKTITAGWYLLALAMSVNHFTPVIANAFGAAGTPFATSGGYLPGYGYSGASGVTGAFGSTLGGTGVVPNVVPVIAVEMTF